MIRLLIVSTAALLITGCASLRGPLEDDTDDAVDMLEHPRRAETPSLFGPGSERVTAGKFPVIRFNGDGTAIPSSENSKVQSVARWLTGNPERVLVAAGAKAASPEYARQLSDQRARNVRDALVSAGVPASKIQTVSFGEDAESITGGGVSFSLIGTGEKR